MRRGVGLTRRASPIDASIPRADVLADVAAVDLGAERLAMVHRDRLRDLRRVREAARGVEHTGLVERTGRARIDAERAGAAACVERRRRRELGCGDERAEDDPRPVLAGDQHRVLPVETDPGAGGRLAVDVLIRVDEDTVGSAELASERVELLAQLGVPVAPGVARQPAAARLELRLGSPVAEGCRDDASRAVEQLLGVARDLGPGGRESEAPEQASRAPLADVPLGVDVRFGERHPDGVEAELGGETLHLVCRHGSLLQRRERNPCYPSGREGDPHPRGGRPGGAPLRGRD